jgi:signal peptidase II
VARGSVVDFLNVGLGSVRTGVFNVADVAIMVGAGIFVLAEFLEGRTLSSSAGTGRPA